MRESTHCGRGGTLHPIAYCTDCYDDIRYGVLVACGLGPKLTEVKPNRDYAATIVTNAAS